MKQININIKKSEIYEKVEGLSVNIGEKNPDVDFNAIWASEGDEASLDLYYEEALTDLKGALAKWYVEEDVKETDPVYDSFDVIFSVNNGWPQNYMPLLTNKLKEYLAHATLSAWIANIPALKDGSGMMEMAAADLEDMAEVLIRREIVAVTNTRHTDEDVSEDNVYNTTGRHQNRDRCKVEVRHEEFKAESVKFNIERHKAEYVAHDIKRK